MHSVRIELAKLILVATRITYQAIGDAGVMQLVFPTDFRQKPPFTASEHGTWIASLHQWAAGESVDT